MYKKQIRRGGGSSICVKCKFVELFSKLLIHLNHNFVIQFCFIFQLMVSLLLYYFFFGSIHINNVLHG